MKKKLNKGLMLIIVSIILLCLLPGSGIMAEKLVNKKTDAILNEKQEPPVDNNKEAVTVVNSLEEIPDITIQGNSDRQVVVVYANSGENNVKNLEINANDIQSGEMVSDRVDILEVKEDINVDDFTAQLKTNPDVLAVDQNQVITVSALPSDAYIQSGDAWQFEKIGAGKTWDKISNTEPVVVAVIDTGLNVSHPDLQGRIAAGYDYVKGIANIVDVAGHGTIVSGCIAAFSQYNNQVDLSVPGFQLFTTTKDGDYSIASGISFSTPLISGACAVLKAVDSNLTASGVENILKEMALDLGAPGRDNYFGTV